MKESIIQQQLIPYRKSNRWGFSDSKGRVLIDCIYSEVCQFHNGFAWVRNDSNWKLINDFGQSFLESFYKNPSNIIFLGEKLLVVNNDIYDFKTFKPIDSLKIEKRLLAYLIVKKTYLRFPKNQPYYSYTKYGVLDEKGDYLIDFHFDNISECNSNNDYSNKDIEGFYVWKKNKIGFIDLLGRQLIDCLYDEVHVVKFSNYFLVTLDSKCGIMRTDGKILLPFQFDNLYSISDSLFACGKYLFPKAIEGFIDKKYDLVAPTYYDEAKDYEFGLSVVIKSWKYGVIDNKGNEIVPLKYDEAKLLRGGYILIKLRNNYGLLDRRGSALLPIKYSHIVESSLFINYFIVSKVSWKGEEVGLFDSKTIKFIVGCENSELEILSENKFKICKRIFLNKQGETIDEKRLLEKESKIKNEFKAWLKGWKEWDKENKYLCDTNDENEIEWESDFGSRNTSNYLNDYDEPCYDVDEDDSQYLYYEFWDHIGLSIQEKWAICDLTKSNKPRYIYDEFKVFNNKSFAYRSGEYWGILNINLEECIPPKFKDIKELSFDLFKVKISNSTRWQIYSLGSDQISDKQFDDILLLNEVILVKEEDKFGFYSKSLAEIVSPFYDSIVSAGIENIFIVQKDKHWGIIQSSGDVLFECKYDKIDSFINGRAIFQKDCNIFGYLHFNGKEEAIKESDELVHLGQGIIRIKRNNRFGIGNFNGEIVSEIRYTNIHLVNEKYIYVYDGNNKGLLSIDGVELIPCNYFHIEVLNDRRAFVFKEHRRPQILFDIENKKELVTFSSIQVFPLFEKYLLDRCDEKYGLLDYDGNLILPIEYDRIEIDLHDFIKVSINCQYGLTDKKGNFIIQLQANPINVFEDYFQFGDNYVDFSGQTLNKQEIEKRKYLNFNNNQIRFTSIYPFVNDFARFKIESIDSEQWNVMDLNGQYITPNNFIEIKYTQEVIFCKNSLGWHLLRENGELIIQENVDNFRILSKNGPIAFEKNRKWGVVNSEAFEIIPPEYEQIICYEWCDYIEVQKVGKHGLYNKKGEVVLDCLYNKVEIYDNNTLICFTDNQIFIFNKEGGLLFGELAQDLIPCENNVFSLKVDSKWGLINRLGQKYIPIIYDEIISLNSELFGAKKEGYWGIFDRWGKAIFPLSFDSIKTTDHKNKNSNFLICAFNRKVGLLNSSGNMIVHPEYDEIEFLTEDLAILKKKSKKGVLNLKGEFILSIEFDEIGLLNNSSEYIKVRLNYMEGIYDLNGNKILEAKYPKIVNCFNDLYEVRLSNGCLGFVDKSGKEYWSDDKV